MFVFLKIAMAAALIQNPSATQQDPLSHMSKQDLRAKLKNAHTEQEFALLARYFHNQAVAFEELAREQKNELEYALAHPWIGTKYPSSSERARLLLSYFQKKKQQSLAEEHDYELKASKAVSER